MPCDGKQVEGSQVQVVDDHKGSYDIVFRLRNPPSASETLVLHLEVEGTPIKGGPLIWDAHLAPHLFGGIPVAAWRHESDGTAPTGAYGEPIFPFANSAFPTVRRRR